MSKSLSAGGSGKKATTIFAGMAGLTLVGGGALIFVMNGRISAERTQVSGLTAQVGDSEQVAKRLKTTQDAYDQTRAKIALLETSVTQKSYVPTLLQQLQKLAASTRLSVTSVQPSQITTPAAPAAANADGSTPKKAAAAPAYSTLDVGLSVTGTYADTQRFLYGLTRFPKVVSVSSIQMTPGASGPAGATAAASVTTNLKMTAFVFPDDAPPADPAGAGAATPPAAGGAIPAGGVVPPASAPTLAGAAGRTARGAVQATQAANTHGEMPARSL